MFLKQVFRFYQVFLEEFKYIVKEKMTRYFTDDPGVFSYDSDKKILVKNIKSYSKMRANAF